MIGPSYHLFHLSNYHMFIKGINWPLSANVLVVLLYTYFENFMSLVADGSVVYILWELYVIGSLWFYYIHTVNTGTLCHW